MKKPDLEAIQARVGHTHREHFVSLESDVMDLLYYARYLEEQLDAHNGLVTPMGTYDVRAWEWGRERAVLMAEIDRMREQHLNDMRTASAALETALQEVHKWKATAEQYYEQGSALVDIAEKALKRKS